MNTVFKMATSMHALFSIFPVLVSRVILDTCRCVWTGKFDLNMDTCGRGNFESGRKKLQIPKYPDARGRGLKIINLGILSTVTAPRILP